MLHSLSRWGKRTIGAGLTNAKSWQQAVLRTADENPALASIR
jgi:hypothetical protein